MLRLDSVVGAISREKVVYWSGGVEQNSGTITVEAPATNCRYVLKNPQLSLP